MSCTNPMKGYKAPNGGFTYKQSQSLFGEHMTLPCGNCVSCRLQKSIDRGIRCMHEASMWEDNIFATFTFDNEHLPKDKNLDYEIFKTFIKNLRWHLSEKKINPKTNRLKRFYRQLRFFACGEYGGNIFNENDTWLWDRRNYTEKGLVPPTIPRAHFHAIIFNWRPHDAEPYYISKSGRQVYKSNYLSRIWKNGRCDFGDVTLNSCQYVARYQMKKQNSNVKTGFTAKYGQPLYDYETGEYICHHPETPELAYGSTGYTDKETKKRYGAIGSTWLEKYYKTDCFNLGFVLGPLPKAKKMKIPNYYWKWLEKNHPSEFIHYRKQYEKDLEKLEDKFIAESDNLRLEAKEKIINQKVKKLIRS